MEVDNITIDLFKGVISSLIAVIIVGFVNLLFNKNKKISSSSSYYEKLAYYLSNPFNISLFISIWSTLLLMSTVLFYWGNNLLNIFGIISILSTGATIIIYKIQCPNCKSILMRKKINTDIIKEERIPYIYREETSIIDEDGKELEHVYGKKDKVRLERVRTEQINYQCDRCNYKWNETVAVNLDEETRPKPSIRQKKK